jgi:uncharacterized protein (DUF3820 family)
MDEIQPNKQHLIKLANTRMPFGRYQNSLLVNLPEPYLVWFKQKGFPKGELGQLLEEMYEIKLNGLEYLIKPLITQKPRIHE